MMREGTTPARPFDAVLVFDQLRLSGSMEEYLALAERLRRNSVKLSVLT